MSLETSRLRITGVTGGPLRITGASLVNGAYELATAGGADYELQTERQVMLDNILFVPGIDGRIVNPPNGFSYSPPYTITKSGASFSTNYDPESTVPSTTSIFYVDVATGSDSNAGTEASPFKSIYQAVHNRNADILVYVAPGIYEGNDSWRGALAGTNFNERNVVVRRWGSSGKIVSRFNLTGLTWTLHAGTTWKATTSGITGSRVIDLTELDANGNAVVLQNRSSVALVEANAGSSHYASNEIYVHTHDGREPDVNVKVGTSLVNGQFRGKTLWVEHIDFELGQFAFSSQTFAAFEQRLYLHNCKFLYGLQAAGGCQFDNAVEAISYQCEASNNEVDGFKYLSTGGVYKVNYSEIDCAGYNNGLKGVTNVANGSSAHDGCSGVRINGTYQGSRGRNIHDITSGQSWLVNCISGPSEPTTSAGNLAAFAAGTGVGDTQQMWLDSCTSLSLEADLEASVDATIRFKNLTTTAGVNAGTGTIIPY
jgi:hypothetical protein